MSLEVLTYSQYGLNMEFVAQNSEFVGVVEVYDYIYIIFYQFLKADK